MNYPITRLIFLFLLLCILKDSLGQNGRVQSWKLNVEDFEKEIKAIREVQLLDVRTPEEYKKGHLKDALNADWNNGEFADMVEALDKGQPVYVYCLSGGRSANAAEAMRAAGFKEVYELTGGTMAWDKSGKPLENLKKSAGPEMTLEAYHKKLNSDRLVLVDFNAPWCAPCKKMAPMLDELSKTQKEKMELVKINIEDNKTLASSLEVDILPTLILYKNKKAVWKHEGYIDREKLLEVIDNVQ